ncbi:MAG: hypothetical protein AAFP90_16285, partial [Planctomycetota bacterium]
MNADDAATTSVIKGLGQNYYLANELKEEDLLKQMVDAIAQVKSDPLRIQCWAAIMMRPNVINYLAGTEHAEVLHIYRRQDVDLQQRQTALLTIVGNASVLELLIKSEEEFQQLCQAVNDTDFGGISTPDTQERFYAQKPILQRLSQRKQLDIVARMIDESDDRNMHRFCSTLASTSLDVLLTPFDSRQSYSRDGTATLVDCIWEYLQQDATSQTYTYVRRAFSGLLGKEDALLHLIDRHGSEGVVQSLMQRLEGSTRFSVLQAALRSSKKGGKLLLQPLDDERICALLLDNFSGTQAYTVGQIMQTDAMVSRYESSPLLERMFDRIFSDEEAQQFTPLVAYLIRSTNRDFIGLLSKRGITNKIVRRFLRGDIIATRSLYSTMLGNDRMWNDELHRVATARRMLELAVYGEMPVTMTRSFIQNDIWMHRLITEGELEFLVGESMRLADSASTAKLLSALLSSNQLLHGADDQQLLSILDRFSMLQAGGRSDVGFLSNRHAVEKFFRLDRGELLLKLALRKTAPPQERLTDPIVLALRQNDQDDVYLDALESVSGSTAWTGQFPLAEKEYAIRRDVAALMSNKQTSSLRSRARDAIGNSRTILFQMLVDGKLAAFLGGCNEADRSALASALARKLNNQRFASRLGRPDVAASLVDVLKALHSDNSTSDVETILRSLPWRQIRESGQFSTIRSMVFANANLKKRWESRFATEEKRQAPTNAWFAQQ